MRTVGTTVGTTLAPPDDRKWFVLLTAAAMGVLTFVLTALFDALAARRRRRVARSGPPTALPARTARRPETEERRTPVHS